MTEDPEQLRRGLLWNRRFLANIITTLACICLAAGLLAAFYGFVRSSEDAHDGSVFIWIGAASAISAIIPLGLASAIRQAVDNAEAISRIEQSLAKR